MRSKAILVGLVAGAASAGVMVVAATFGALIGVPLLVIGLLIPPRLYAAGATLIGFGAVTAILFGRVAVTCQAPGCEGGDVAGTFAIAGVLCMAIGVAPLLLAMLRERNAT